MLNIVTFDGTNPEDIVEYYAGRYIKFLDTRDVEEEFLFLYNQMLLGEDEGLWDGDRPSFDTPFDITIMKEIDGAERLELQVVRTEIGMAPLTCLSTGCKFGLLVNYYSSLECKIVAEWGVADEKVFELIGRELNMTIYMDRSKMIDYLVPIYCRKPGNILIDGERHFRVFELKKDICTVTSQKLKIANKSILGRMDEMLHIPLCMSCGCKGMDKIIGEVGYRTLSEEAEEKDFIKELTFNIRTNEIIKKSIFKYPILWVFKKKGEKYEFNLGTGYKYPDIIDSILEVDSYYRKDMLADEVFMVVFEMADHILINFEYSKDIAYSIVYNPKERVMDFLGTYDTVVKLDAIASEGEIKAG